MVPHWYAVYTCSQHEKRVAEQLANKEITCFLPLREVQREWRNRKIATVQFPLFSGYLFVNIPLSARLKVLETPGVVRLVGFGRLPEPVPEEQVYALLSLLESKFQYDRHPYLNAGTRVLVKSGPLRGTQGILVRRKGKCKLIISVDLIRQSVALEINADCVEPASMDRKLNSYMGA